MSEIIRGISGAGGIGVGRVLRYQSLQMTGKDRRVGSPTQELAALQLAIDSFCEEAEQRARLVEQELGSWEAGILRSQVQMANDPVLLEQMEGKIQLDESATTAVVEVCDTFIQLFLQSDDELFRERATDVKDVKCGLLAHLSGNHTVDLSAVGEDTVICAEELPPSFMAELQGRDMAGIVLGGGGRNSHCAILARAMKIPLVLGLGEKLQLLMEGALLVVDGEEGLVILSPGEREQFVYREQMAKAQDREKFLLQYVGRETLLADGSPLHLGANASGIAEVREALRNGAEGIGLLRSEFFYLEQTDFPAEEQEFAEYRDVLRELNGAPLTVRLLDVGGDKTLPYCPMPPETNPALGCRGIRFSLQHMPLLRSQLRAILRAGAFGRIRVLIPMVTSIREVQTVRQILRRLQNELGEQELKAAASIELGVMIETPAAVLLAEELAREADFFSVGTNDLSQYIMCADRDNSQVSTLCSCYAPAMLRTLLLLSKAAAKTGISVGVCGEAAADARLVPVLLGLGVDRLSVVPSAVPEIRRVISQWGRAEAQELLQKVMTLSEEREVRELLEREERE